MNILIVDDDREIVDAIGVYLEAEGYNILKSYDGLEALNVLSDEEIHLILMDIMMPKMDGLKTITRIREDKNIPVIIISAKTEDADKVLGLNIGADDYITKPFNPLELVARVKSQLRRYTSLGSMDIKENYFVTGGLELDDDKKLVKVDGEIVDLTPVQYKILRLLMANMDKVFSMTEIYEKVWCEEAIAVENTVAVHIRRIREKIEINPKEPRYLKVVWGIGYKIEKQ